MSILVDIKIGDPEDAAARFQLAGYAMAFHSGASPEVIAFNPEGHVYRRKDTGEVVPSVTQILKETRVSTDFDELATLRQDIGSNIERRRDIGTAVHQAAHYFDDDDLDWGSVDPEVLPYLMAWVTFRAAYPHLRPATRERRVYHEAYRYTGTLDAIFCVGAETTIEIRDRWSVQLVPDAIVPYRVTPYNEHPWLDDRKFQAFVTTYYEQRDRRRAA